MAEKRKKTVWFVYILQIESWIFGIDYAFNLFRKSKAFIILYHMKTKKGFEEITGWNER